MEGNYSTANAFKITPIPDHDRNLMIPTVVVAFCGLGFFFKYFITQPNKSICQEPPILKTSIPFIGHMIGMLRWQVGYMQMLSSKVPSWPAFTLKIFSSRIYVICDPSLIAATFRNTSAFDFGSFIVESSERAFNISEHGMKIMRGETAPGYDPNGPYLNGNKGLSFLGENHKLMTEMLSSGSSLQELNRNVLSGIAGSVNKVQDGDEVGLYSWIRDILTISTSSALYGPQDPLANDYSLVGALWDFEAKMTLLMLKFLPKVIAKGAYDGRTAIREAFTKYYAQSHHESASNLVKMRLANARKWGFTEEDIANFEISTLYVATTNTVGTSFWMICNILSAPSLLSDIRSEVEAITEQNSGQAKISTSGLLASCPLLLSSFYETLRLVDAATSVRSVISSVDLKSSTSSVSYAIKSPAVIQLPSGITHSSPKIWGSDVSEFNPERFLSSTKASLDKETRKMQKDGYFPFGGGKHLCPGRHFATLEILAFVAAFCLGFDIEGAGAEDKDVNGKIKVPKRAFQKLGTAIRKPVRELNVNIKRRKGWEGVQWGFETGTSAVE